MEQEKARILVVDDERTFATLLQRILQQAGHEVQAVYCGKDAIRCCEDFSPNVVITDLKLPDMSGIEVMHQIRSKRPEMDFILITAFATVETAVQAMKEGAIDYLIKPLKDPDEIKLSVARILERQSLLAANTLWQKQLADGIPGPDILFAGMEHIQYEIRQVAKTDATVLLLGESGTGKSLIAKYIHKLSDRKGPFVDINCAAMPETLIESELFGHEKGAFTGAVKTKQGKFELASQGTIFLDEIGEMPIALQSKLLRVLQERAFERVGGISTITTSARIIAATNQDLLALMKEKRFREDLYYRLSVFPITIPPLRQRPGAIKKLTPYLVQVICAKIGKKNMQLSDEQLHKLTLYSWPGNVRELHNVLERAVILSSDELVLPELQDQPMIRQQQMLNTMPQEGTSLPLTTLDAMEKAAIQNALKATGGHRRKTSEILGISLRTLQYKLKQYNLE
jgi:DNA-binding NtrC family response regulator